ncbi:ATP-binding protein [Microbacterium sp.]|uniref:sensor histidine kinase n=1 Tax=Microbacterium sp. TaxID=51671 RepID=UPI00260916ED|nr:ATP-binding protein [Microbacterium sp.]
MRRDKELVGKLAAAFNANETDPRDLIRLVGQTLRARWCELTVGTRTYEWSSPRGRAADPIRCALSDDPEIVIAISPPSAMLTPQQWQPLLILVEPLAYTEAKEQAQRLRNDAVRRLDDLRWRASIDMAQERRRLERDLHDGAQHHLVAVQLAIAVAEHQQGETGELERRRAARSQLDSAESVLLATARGVLPRTLADNGLSGALHALSESGISVHADLPRLMPAVESALYFTALEAVSNAQKYAPGARINVDALMKGDRVTVSISDNGPGFIVRKDGVGGLSRLAQRLQAANGVLDVQSAPGKGTRVSAWIRY